MVQNSADTSGARPFSRWPSGAGAGSASPKLVLSALYGMSRLVGLSLALCGLIVCCFMLAGLALRGPGEHRHACSKSRQAAAACSDSVHGNCIKLPYYACRCVTLRSTTRQRWGKKERRHWYGWQHETHRGSGHTSVQQRSTMQADAWQW